MKILRLTWFGSLVLSMLFAGRAQSGPTAEDFTRRMVEILPEQDAYDYHRFLESGPLHEFKRNPKAQMAPGTMMLEHSWRDPDKWRGYIGATVNPYWPYTVTRMVFYPDFTNQVNRAEQYALSVSGIGRIEGTEQLDPDRVLKVFLKYLRRAADGFEAGLKSYRQAAFQSPQDRRDRAFREVLIVEQMQRMLRSDAAILEFEDLRFDLVQTQDRSRRTEILERMEQLLKEEIKRTEASLQAARRDSRLGFEFEQDYVYTPYVLKEKLEVLDETLKQQLPAYRAEHGF